MIQRVLDKLTSGRFLLTLTSCYVFCFMVVKRIIDKNDVVQLIMLIATFYFMRNDRNNPTKGNQDA